MSKRERDVSTVTSQGVTERHAQPQPTMANYDEVLTAFKKYLIDGGSTLDNAMWQEIVVHNFLWIFVPEHGYLLVKR